MPRVIKSGVCTKCEELVTVAGLCAKHYAEYKKSMGHRLCSRCSKVTYADGLCKKHYDKKASDRDGKHDDNVGK